MKENNITKNWKDFIPVPVYDEHPEYNELYEKAWELAFEHIKNIDGMPQTPYMDEAFCATQIWIWDSCFMSLFCKYAREVFPGVETLKNFYDVLYEGKHLPVIMPPEDEPYWTKAVYKEPYEIKIHIADNPPLFAWAEYENALMKGDRGYLKELLYERRVLQKHYDWIEGLHANIDVPGVLCKTHLISEEYGYRWEGGSSGMDNTPRGRTGEHALKERPNNPDMLWLDAICQQAMSAKTIARLFALVGDKGEEERWNEKYEEKKKIINGFYWDNDDEFYYDIDCNTHNFYKVRSVASFWTLTSETATEDRAQILAEHILNPNTFGGRVPLVSLSRSDNDFKPDGRYWRGALWLPTAYAALKGVVAYGFYGIAHNAALEIIEHMFRTYKDYEPHTVWECYNPEKCEPSVTPYDEKKIVRKDFCGWSALGPISMYIEFILGFYSIDAFTNTVKWAKTDSANGNIGIKNLRFGNIVTNIVANTDECFVTSNAEYTLEINGKAFMVSKGENKFSLLN